jgi:hypothetical protein
MKTVLICSRCGCGFGDPRVNGVPHDGPLWQWPGGNQFGPRCGGIIEARIISGESNGRDQSEPRQQRLDS